MHSKKHVGATLVVARGLFALAPTSVIPEKYNYVYSIIPSLSIGVKFSDPFVHSSLHHSCRYPKEESTTVVGAASIARGW